MLRYRERVPKIFGTLSHCLDSLEILDNLESLDSIEQPIHSIFAATETYVARLDLRLGET